MQTPFPIFAVSIVRDGAEVQVGLHVVYGIDPPRLLSDAPEGAAVAYFAPMLSSGALPTLCGHPLHSSRHAAEVAARDQLDTAARHAARMRLADFRL